MTSSELADFVARVRRLFGGPMDEELFALAKERIAGLKARPCNESLDEYALAHGGPRSRFIPAKFLEVYTRRTTDQDSRADATEREARKRAAAIGADLEAEKIRKEWEGIRREVAEADPARRSIAVGVLRRAGWLVTDSDPVGWRETMLLAVRDLMRGEPVMVRDKRTGEWTVSVSAVEFWTELVPKPQGLAQAASEPWNAVQTGSTLGRRTGEARRVSEAPALAKVVAADLDEIPF